MITKILTLLKIARRIAQSDIINIVSKFHEVPKIVKFFSYILSFSFSFSNSNKLDNKNLKTIQNCKKNSSVRYYKYCLKIS